MLEHVVVERMFLVALNGTEVKMHRITVSRASDRLELHLYAEPLRTFKTILPICRSNHKLHAITHHPLLTSIISSSQHEEQSEDRRQRQHRNRSNIHACRASNLDRCAGRGRGRCGVSCSRGVRNGGGRSAAVVCNQSEVGAGNSRLVCEVDDEGAVAEEGPDAGKGRLEGVAVAGSEIFGSDLAVFA